MRPYLHPQWRASIEQFRVTFNSFTQQFETVQPISAARDPSRLTYKIRCLINEVPEWITRHECSLARVSEQAFEAVHHDFLLFSANYKIPRSGEKIVAGRKRMTSSSKFLNYNPFPARETPSCGTRSNETPQKMLKSFQQNSPPPSKSLAKPLIGDTRKARAQTLLAVTAYNSSHLPVSADVQDRQIRAVLCLSKKKSCKKQKREPDEVRPHSIVLLRLL